VTAGGEKLFGTVNPSPHEQLTRSNAEQALKLPDHVKWRYPYLSCDFRYAWWAFEIRAQQISRLAKASEIVPA
jgi:hypothetical protein